MTHEETALCITHYLEGAMPCMVRDKHFAACDDDTCEGCVPREATHGFVCDRCWNRIVRARAEWSEFIEVFEGEVRAVQPEPGGGSAKPSSRLPLSPLQLAVDEILRLHSAAVSEVWVSSFEGTVQALEFARAVERATRAFPRQEGQKRLSTNRCPKCGRRSLVYAPANHVGGEATVQCLSSDCNHVMDHSEFERIALIEAQCCRRCRTLEGCADPECTCHRVAPVPEWQRTNKPSKEEPYQPTSDAHSDLDVLTTHRVADLQKLAIELEIPRANQLRKPDLIAAIRAAESETE